VSFQKAGKEENDILGEVYFALCEGSGFIRERNRPSIIRYSPFNVNIDRQNYFRALVMLHSPWTDEQADLIQRNCEEFYQGNEAAIKANFDRLLLLLNVDALRAVQTSGPNDTKHVLVTRGPIFISGKFGSRGRYIEQIKKGQNID